MIVLPEGSYLAHARAPYDPKKAREYYLRTRKLKGRKAGAGKASAFIQKLNMVEEGGADAPAKAIEFVKSIRGKSDDEIRKLATAHEKANNLMPGAMDTTVKQLIANRERVRGKAAGQRTSAKEQAELKVKQVAAAKQVSDLRKKLADLNRQLKEKMAEARKAEAQAKKPKTAAEKAEAARDAKQYRDKNQQKLKSQRSGSAAKDKASGEPKTDGVAGLKESIAQTQKSLKVAVARQRSLQSATKTG